MSHQNYYIKKKTHRAGDMAQQTKADVAKYDDPI